MRAILGLGLAAAASIAAGTAAQAAPGVEIRNAIARVTIVPEARSDVAVFVTKANRRTPLRISRVGETVIVDGGLGFWRSVNCHDLFGHASASAWGVGSISYEDMPQVVVRMPAQARVGASGAVYGAVGPGAGLDLSNSGCGDWKVADQNGPLRLSLAGSGDVRAGTVASAETHTSGSGDIYMVAARGGLKSAIAGSGDVAAGVVDGPIGVHIAGAGDVKIRSGAATDINVSIAGSGDVKYGGVAQSLEASIAGSGDVDVAKVTGPVSKHIAGSGDVTVDR